MDKKRVDPTLPQAPETNDFVWQGITFEPLAPAEIPRLTPCCTVPQDKGDSVWTNARRALSHLPQHENANDNLYA